MTRVVYIFFFFNDTATTEIYTLSLHDALPISVGEPELAHSVERRWSPPGDVPRQPDDDRRRHDDHLCRSEEHTSELQSPCNLVCRLLLEKKKVKYNTFVPMLNVSSHDNRPRTA